MKEQMAYCLKTPGGRALYKQRNLWFISVCRFSFRMVRIGINVIA